MNLNVGLNLIAISAGSTAEELAVRQFEDAKAPPFVRLMALRILKKHKRHDETTHRLVHQASHDVAVGGQFSISTLPLLEEYLFDQHRKSNSLVALEYLDTLQGLTTTCNLEDDSECGLAKVTSL